jgi:hypothetical protein
LKESRPLFKQEMQRGGKEGREEPVSDWVKWRSKTVFPFLQFPSLLGVSVQGICAYRLEIALFECCIEYPLEMNTERLALSGQKYQKEAGNAETKNTAKVWTKENEEKRWSQTNCEKYR